MHVIQNKKAIITQSFYVSYLVRTISMSPNLLFWNYWLGIPVGVVSAILLVIEKYCKSNPNEEKKISNYNEEKTKMDIENNYNPYAK